MAERDDSPVDDDSGSSTAEPRPDGEVDAGVRAMLLRHVEDVVTGNGGRLSLGQVGLRVRERLPDFDALLTQAVGGLPRGRLRRLLIDAEGLELEGAGCHHWVCLPGQTGEEGVPPRATGEGAPAEGDAPPDARRRRRRRRRKRARGEGDAPGAAGEGDAPSAAGEGDAPSAAGEGDAPSAAGPGGDAPRSTGRRRRRRRGRKGGAQGGDEAAAPASEGDAPREAARKRPGRQPEAPRRDAAAAAAARRALRESLPPPTPIVEAPAPPPPRDPSYDSDMPF